MPGLLALIAADPQWWLGALFVALGTAAGVLTVPLVRVFIGEAHPFTTDLYVIVPVMAAAGALLSPIMIPARPMVSAREDARVEATHRRNADLICEASEVGCASSEVGLAPARRCASLAGVIADRATRM